MDSVTRGSGIALSVLIAATASVLLLLPGKPAGSWRGPGTPGRVVMASAAATSTSGHARTRIAALRQQPGRRPAGGRATPGVPCRRRAQRPGPAGVTSLRPA